MAANDSLGYQFRKKKPYQGLGGGYGLNIYTVWDDYDNEEDGMDDAGNDAGGDAGGDAGMGGDAGGDTGGGE